MGKTNRAMRRQIERKAFRNNLKVDDIREEAAQVMCEDAVQQAVKLLTCAAVLTVCFRFKNLQKRDERVKRFLETTYEYVDKIKNDQLTSEENDAVFDVLEAMKGYRQGKHKIWRERK